MRKTGTGVNSEKEKVKESQSRSVTSSLDTPSGAGLGASQPPPPEDPHRFISWEAERIYHESLFKRSFVLEQGFPTSNVFFNFIIQNRGWQILCAPPVPKVAPVVREFHFNLPFKVDTTVFVRRKWVEFGAQAINQIYHLLDDDGEEYRDLFADTDYERLM